MIYLLKPSPPFVAGPTLGVADATATAVAELTIKQFWPIPLAGKVVAGPCMMAMPLFLFLCQWVARHMHVQSIPAKVEILQTVGFHQERP